MNINRNCCELFSYYLNYTCDLHTDRCDCPDVVLVRKGEQYGIPLHDGTRRWIPIRYCPWCGKRVEVRGANKKLCRGVQLRVRRRISLVACCQALDRALHPFMHCEQYTTLQPLILQGKYDSGISILDGGRSYIQIRYCPWCGTRQRFIPEILRIYP